MRITGIGPLPQVLPARSLAGSGISWSAPFWFGVYDKALLIHASVVMQRQRFLEIVTVKHADFDIAHIHASEFERRQFFDRRKIFRQTRLDALQPIPAADD